MTQEALADAIQGSIRDKTHATARMFARSHTNLSDNDFEIHPSMDHIYQDMLAFPKSPPPSETLEQYREDIILALRNYYGLAQYHGMVFDWAFHHIILCRAANSQGVPPQAGALFDAHVRFLFHIGEKHSDKKTFPPLAWGLAGEFAPMIPLRMTRSVYNDYLRASFHMMAMSKEGPPSILYRITEWENLRNMLVNTKLPDACMDIKRLLDDYWQTDFPLDNLDDIRRQMNKLDEAGEQLKLISASLFILLDTVDAALIMQKFGTDEDMDDLRAWIGKDPAAQDDAIAEALDALDAAADREEALHGMEDNALKKWTVLNELYYDAGPLHYRLVPLAISSDTEQSVNKIIEDAIGIVDVCADGQPNRRKRYLRQYFMRNMPLPYNDVMKGYRDYFIGTYERLDDFNKTLTATCAEFFEITVSSRYGQHV